MCMTYFKPKKGHKDEPEPLDLCIFALVSKEIRIMEIKHSGSKKDFGDIASVTVDGLPTHMEIEQHKVTNKILVIIGLQSISQKLLQKKQDTNMNNEVD